MNIKHILLMPVTTPKNNYIKEREKKIFDILRDQNTSQIKRNTFELFILKAYACLITIAAVKDFT